MFSNGNSYSFGSNGGSCSLGFDPFEPAVFRLVTTDARHPAVR